MTQIAIIVPCYNEADRLKCNAFIEFVRKHRDITFIFVDDGSTDKTGELLAAMCRIEQNNSRLITFETNHGKAEAVRQGTLSAIAAGAVYVGYWDADLATPLGAILDFVEQFKQRADLLAVIGARVQLLGRNINRTYSRHYLGRIFATLASIVLRLPVYDTQCGAKLFVTSEPVARAFKEPFISRWIFDVEIFARLMHRTDVNARSRIYEFPLTEWTDVRGSKIKVKDFFMALWDLGWIHFTYRRC